MLTSAGVPAFAAPSLFKQAVSAVLKPKGNLGEKQVSAVKEVLEIYFKLR